MTNIIKELKELDAKATSAPWSCSEVMGHVHVKDASQETVVGFSTYGGNCKYLHNARMMTASRNALPELIRVIELAEEALKQVNEKSHFVPAIVQEAISEIRKLKGE